jgi:hypothetical protein
MAFSQRYERRYTGKVVSLTLWQSIAGLFQGRGWTREKYVFEEVFPDDPGYETAPYAEAFTWN